MQAGYYGTPASRPRIIILAAKKGKVLPRFPSISHLFPTGKQAIPFGEEVYISADTSYAPHAGITGKDALGDLSEGTVRNIKDQARYPFEPFTNFQRRAREENRRTVAMHAVPLGVAEGYASECNWLFGKEKQMLMVAGNDTSSISRQSIRMR
jgi:site-specific DNA-cytosine methylase